jgi:hypothetical protein
MGTWLWVNIPLALFFFCCWSGIPLWLTLTRWNAELKEKHAELAARHAKLAASTVPGSAPAVAPRAGSPVYAGLAGPPAR